MPFVNFLIKLNFSFKPENPKFKVPKPQKTVRKPYRRAFKQAFKEAKRLKGNNFRSSTHKVIDNFMLLVLAPRIMRNMPLQTSIISDFQKFVINLADSVEKAFTSSPTHASGAKEIILNLTNQIDRVVKVLEGNGKLVLTLELKVDKN